ncbi:response regulator receiver [Methanosarcina horonobensis HB-1 = JCM 15518]|uniref:Response regulator receiver n=1 Tax=Methanosarcina horonobensis HB-1 = JCM 15518 TaxID=1434110 RepID=A0A0E3WTI1_9EURY|nr:response regulator [Methanosarcina horonobensis]AKB77895.1 response regulator receiver [Methanosarcina horonobensis HB-1 = JCM 15518]
MTSILVVEDNPLNMELVTCLLELNGIEVTQAVDGLEALDKIKNSLFDLVLLDIQLPGMGGLDVLKHIKEDPASQYIGVVALTAQVLVGDKQRFIDAGFIGYISKPIDVFQFMDELNTFLGHGGKA